MFRYLEIKKKSMNDALKQKVNTLYVNRYIYTHFVSGSNNRDKKGQLCHPDGIWVRLRKHLQK